MLSKKSTGLSYLSRILAFLMIAGVFAAFTIRPKTMARTPFPPEQSGMSHIPGPLMDTLPKKGDPASRQNSLPVEADSIVMIKQGNRNINLLYRNGSSKPDTVVTADRVGIIGGEFQGIVVVDGKLLEGNLSDVTITPDDIASLEVLKGEEFYIQLYGEKARNGIILIHTKKAGDKREPFPRLMFQEGGVTKNITYEEAEQFQGIILLDGKKFTGRIAGLPVTKNEILGIALVTGEKLDQEFGPEARNGVLTVYTKKSEEAEKKFRQQKPTEPVFTKAEQEPRFPGGQNNWVRFLQQNLRADIAVKNGAPAGTYQVMVQFIVTKEGKITDVKSLTQNGYGMEQEVVRLMELSPDWEPARQNKQVVHAYKKQPVTFVISEDNKRNQ